MAVYYPCELTKNSLLPGTKILSNVSYLIKAIMDPVEETQACFQITASSVKSLCLSLLISKLSPFGMTIPDLAGRAGGG